VIILSVILFLLGLLVLAKSSSILVDGSSSIAKNFNISPVVIGLTVVAFATSAPELTVSVSAALSGSTDIALGNVLGSNIFNILVVLGISALVYPIHIHRNIVWREIPFSLLAALIVFLFAVVVVIKSPIALDLNGVEVIGYLSRFSGIVLLGFFIAFMIYVIKTARRSDPEKVEIKSMSLPKSSAYILIGILGLVLASKYLVVNSAINIATAFGLSETLIGLTLVAVGTSLPELAASVTAAYKKNSDIAVGNVVGSNIFNLFLILGSTLFITPIAITGQNIFDIIFLLFTTVILFILVFVLVKYKLNKTEGLILLGLYAIYTLYIFMR
jgi:cation:H+ antiporter